MSLTLFLVCAALLVGSVLGHVADDMKEGQKNWFVLFIIILIITGLMSLGAYLF